MIEDGDNVTHWNFGAGIVKMSDPEKHQVPAEWEHDYTSVILVEFPRIGGNRVGWFKEWVLREDCGLVSQR